MVNSHSDNTESYWESYYQRLEGREPRPLFVDALARFGEESDAQGPRHAVDLGFGDGTETQALLQAGWHVFAIDNDPAAVKRLRSRIKPELEERLTLETASFEELEPPQTDFLYAGLSLPFCSPEAFESVWARISNAIRPRGRFAGHFFGMQDDWAGEPTMTFLSLGQVKGLFKGGFEIEVLRETEEDGESSSGSKHWHIFEVIARI